MAGAVFLASRSPMHQPFQRRSSRDRRSSSTPCGSLSPSPECDRPGGDAARLTPPAAGRRSTTMRGGLGRGFAHGALAGGAHGELARRRELRGTRHTRGLSSGLREWARFTESGK